MRAIALSGGRATTIASGDIWDVETDAYAIYFTDINGGRVGRVPKHL